MKIETRTIYKCDHCNKLYQMRHWCEIHEEGCFHNPDNHRDCFTCVHLIKKDHEISFDTYMGEQCENRTLFYCKKIDSFLYPPKVEAKRNWFETHPIENNPMRKSCKVYDDGYGDVYDFLNSEKVNWLTMFSDC